MILVKFIFGQTLIQNGRHSFRLMSGIIGCNLSVVLPGLFGNPLDKLSFRLRVGHPVVPMGFSEFQFEISIFRGNRRMVDQVVPEQQSVAEIEMGLNHVDVMRSIPALVTFDKPGVENGGVFSPRDGRQK